MTRLLALMRGTVCIVALLLVFRPVLASTVLEMSFAQVVQHAELVFEGTVLAVEPRRARDGSIHSYVQFAVYEVVKGQYADSHIELRFLGGKVDGRALHVTDMSIPLPGESGVYFVESLQRAQVNPLVGWAQGHYLLATQADGSRIVTTNSHRVIVSLADADTAPPASSAMNRFSKGMAKGVVVQSRGVLSPLRQALSATQFKAAVRELAAQPR